MDKFTIDYALIESSFSRAEKFLLGRENIIDIVYENFDVTTFDVLNKALLKNVANKCIVYCLWQGDSPENLKPVYIGHAKHTISRQRMRAHLTKKNVATGAQLERVKASLVLKTYLGLTYLEIEPGYMRMALEGWLIDRHIDKLLWNKNK